MPDDSVGTSPGDPVGDRNPALSIGPADLSNGSPVTAQTGFSGPSGLGPVEPNRPAPTTDIFAGTPWLRPTDGPVIQTDTKPIRTCPKCNVPLPIDAISCQRCGRYVPGHKSAKKRLKKDDVDALIAKVKADYQPVTTTDIHLCENLGLTLAELKITRPGSPDHQRSLGSVQTITAILEASRASRPVDAAVVNLEAASADEVCAHAEELLRQAYMVRDSQRSSAAYLTQSAAEYLGPTSEQGYSIVSPAAPTPAPEPTRCPYCKQLQSECDELRKERPEIWEVICSRHPDVQKAKDARATAEMHESLRRANTGGDPWVR